MLFKKIHQRSPFLKPLAVVFNLIFIFSFLIYPLNLRAQTFPNTILNLPPPGTLVSTTSEYVPLILKGVTLNPNNPLQMDFIVDTGDSHLEADSIQLKEEATKLIKYFLASLTVPKKELWVNLSPYENNRIVSTSLGQTEMGRDLLAQDYILKQLTASLLYPEQELGKSFWTRVYALASLAGTTDIPVFNPPRSPQSGEAGEASPNLDWAGKVWIVPDRAVVYEQDKSAFVVDKHLKVMLEEDIIPPPSRSEWGRLGGGEVKVNPSLNPSHKGRENISTNLIKQIIIPEIEKEVNEGKNFAVLRQIYDGMILATWYKKTLKESLLSKVYVDKNKTRGIDTNDPKAIEEIYNQYLDALKKGAYDYIKEDYDPATQNVIPRQYFSGGFDGEKVDQVERTVRKGEVRGPDAAMVAAGLQGHGEVLKASAKLYDVGRNGDVDKAQIKGRDDAAMLTQLENAIGHAPVLYLLTQSPSPVRHRVLAAVNLYQNRARSHGPLELVGFEGRKRILLEAEMFLHRVMQGHEPQADILDRVIAASILRNVPGFAFDSTAYYLAKARDVKDLGKLRDIALIKPDGTTAVNFEATNLLKDVFKSSDEFFQIVAASLLLGSGETYSEASKFLKKVYEESDKINDRVLAAVFLIDSDKESILDFFRRVLRGEFNGVSELSEIIAASHLMKDSNGESRLAADFFTDKAVRPSLMPLKERILANFSIAFTDLWSMPQGGKNFLIRLARGEEQVNSFDRLLAMTFPGDKPLPAIADWEGKDQFFADVRGEVKEEDLNRVMAASEELAYFNSGNLSPEQAKAAVNFLFDIMREPQPKTSQIIIARLLEVEERRVKPLAFLDSLPKITQSLGDDIGREVNGDAGRVRQLRNAITTLRAGFSNGDLKNRAEGAESTYGNLIGNLKAEIERGGRLTPQAVSVDRAMMTEASPALTTPYVTDEWSRVSTSPTAVEATSPVSESDAAMVGSVAEQVPAAVTVGDTASLSDVGGIDLNPDFLDLQIKRDEKGIPLPLNMQPIGEMHIEGIVPVIIKITPIASLPLLLGFSDENKDKPVKNSTNESHPQNLVKREEGSS